METFKYKNLECTLEYITLVNVLRNIPSLTVDCLKRCGVKQRIPNFNSFDTQKRYFQKRNSYWIKALSSSL